MTEIASHEEIQEFIDAFKSGHEAILEKIFTRGNCYWFSEILKQRFGGSIWYLPVSGHFICRIGNRFYDVMGEKKDISECMIFWETYQHMDPAHYERIERCCVHLKNLEEK